MTAKDKNKKVEHQMRVQFLPGVGPKRSEQLARLEVERVYDLLYLFPRRYIDVTNVVKIGSLQHDEREVAVLGKVLSAREIVGRGGRKLGLEVLLEDGSGRISCSFFGRAFLSGVIQKDQRWLVFGDVRRYKGKTQLNPTEYEEVDDSGGKSGGVLPVYPSTEGLGQKALRKMVGAALDVGEELVEHLPENLRQRFSLPERNEALHAIHRPSSPEEAAAGRRALAFDELFYLELMLLGRKYHVGQAARVRRYKKHNHLLKKLAASLPFELTGAQKKVVHEIDDDLTGAHPLSRLVQGDVGSGKTIVALIAALRAVENGYQAAVMAPTEVLAEQHWRTLGRLLEPLEIVPALLLGKQSAAVKRDQAARIASGEAQIAVGTHALIQKGVEFNDLGLAIIDEQHRFGVNQRLSLRNKGRDTDCLVMTATPIPRSLALTLYGDLDVSTIDELPAGRKPVNTHVVPRRKRAGMEQFVTTRVQAGEQAYVVCPRIEDDPESELAAAEAVFEHYNGKVFPDRNVVLLHGRMKPEEKEAAMAAFESGEAQVLVGTTVIEVGIDVARATVIVIEGAERFGLSQLHQLRGRVGRSEMESWCLLVPSADAGADSRSRLEILASTTDGFKISEEDLRLRGPGDFFGQRQSGLPELRCADLIQDYPVLVDARECAREILSADPYLESESNRPVCRELIRRFHNRVGFLKIG
jgi:ATP-dependent DNA helicase RecG